MHRHRSVDLGCLALVDVSNEVSTEPKSIDFIAFLRTQRDERVYHGLSMYCIPG